MKKHPYLSTYGALMTLILCSFSSALFAQSNSSEQQLFQLKIYHLDDQKQEQEVDRYLREAYIPALHRSGIEQVGVFKPVGQDTTSDRRMYVLTPYESFTQFNNQPKTLQNDSQYLSNGAAFLNAPHDDPSFASIESILLEAFSHAPQVMAPNLEDPKSKRVYELRSYHSPTEALNRNKVEMFNEGGEIEIFSRLEFNPVFYGNVVSGCQMPNLMYMISFEDMKSRDDHWDAFREDSKWKGLSALQKYQNNVSGIDNWFLRPTDYSDL